MTQRSFRVAGTCVLALAVACGSQPSPERTPPSGARRVDQSKAGRISGRIVFDGPVPQNPVAKIDDAFCARENPNGISSDTFAVESGGLNNVFVYVKSGLGNYYFDTPAEAVRVDQQACRYVPHVFGVQTRQPIEIINSDSTQHNVNAVASVNRGFNFGQPLKGLKNTATFTAPEVMVHFRCDVHGWMSAYAGVLDHPYFAVTARGGQFELKSVPAGTYTVEAWHEKLGTQTQTVTLEENGAKELTFTFKAPTAS